MHSFEIGIKELSLCKYAELLEYLNFLKIFNSFSVGLSNKDNT